MHGCVAVCWLKREAWDLQRSVERCATPFFFESSRVYVFVALLSAALSFNFYVTDASPQSNASRSTVLKPRMLFSVLESVDQKVTSKCSKLAKLSDCEVLWQPYARQTRTIVSGIFGCQGWLLGAILKELCWWDSYILLYLDGT